jgi:hypothetical protein
VTPTAGYAWDALQRAQPMDLNPALPPLPTLTPLSTRLKILEKPPEPSISMLFLENTQYRIPENPFTGSLPKMCNKEHKESLKIALVSIRAPFIFSMEELIEFHGASVGADMSTEVFNATVTMVIAALERGYFTARDPTPLDPSNQARLSCALLAAISRGYHRQYNTEKEGILDRVRAEAIDPDPLPKNPTLFHRLAATADNLSTHIRVDQEGYQDWYLTLKHDFNTKATKAATTDVNEKWLHWKAEHLERLAQQHEKEIVAQARNHGIEYFISTGQRLGLHITRDASSSISTPTPTTGRKCTVSGSLPRQRSATLTMRGAAPADSCAASPPPPPSSNTPRGRTTTLVNQEMVKKGSTDLDMITEVLKAALGPAIQVAMAPYAAKITELERKSNLTQVSYMDSLPNTSNTPPPAPRGPEGSIWARKDLTNHADTRNDDEFTPVTYNGRGRKAGKKVSTAGPATTQAPQANPTPASYAGVAAATSNTKQPPPRQPPHVLTIMEITVIRSGGLPDTELEEMIRA